MEEKNRNEESKQNNRRYKFEPRDKANIGVEADIAFLATCEEEALVVESSGDGKPIEWYIASGASNHMLTSEAYFERHHKLPETIRIAGSKSGE